MLWFNELMWPKSHHSLFPLSCQLLASSAPGAACCEGSCAGRSRARGRTISPSLGQITLLSDCILILFLTHYVRCSEAESCSLPSRGDACARSPVGPGAGWGWLGSPAEEERGGCGAAQKGWREGWAAHAVGTTEGPFAVGGRGRA